MTAETRGGRSTGLSTRLTRPVDVAVVTAAAGALLAALGAAVPGVTGVLAATAAIGVIAGFSVSGSV